MQGPKCEVRTGNGGRDCFALLARPLVTVCTSHLTPMTSPTALRLSQLTDRSSTGRRSAELARWRLCSFQGGMTGI